MLPYLKDMNNISVDLHPFRKTYFGAFGAMKRKAPKHQLDDKWVRLKERRQSVLCSTLGVRYD